MAKSTLDIILQAYDKMSGPINKAVTNAQGKLSSFAQKSDYLANKAYHSGKEFTAAGFAVVAPLYKAFDAASEFETKMVSIRKQMKAGDDPKAINNMTQGVFKLAKELPLATGEIQELIAAGLKMNIPEKNILDYTRSTTKMAVAFDMAAGEIGESMGVIANVYKIPQDNIKAINDYADVINYLDDNMMASGSDIINVLQRIGGSAQNVGKEFAAVLSSSMLSLGETKERAGTTLDKMLSSLSSATTKTKNFQATLKSLKIDPGQLQRDMADPAKSQGAILKVLQAIKDVDPSKQANVASALFGAYGSRVRKLANNLEMVNEQVKALENGKAANSMQNEFNKRVQSSAAQMQIFKNRINELWVKIGSSLLPIVNQLITKVSVWIDKIGVFITKHPQLVGWILKAAIAFSALAFAGGYLSFMVSGVARLFNVAAVGARFLLNPLGMLTMGKVRLLGAVAKLKTAFIQWRKIVVGAFNAIRTASLTNPVFLIIAAIALAAYLIYEYWSPIKTFFIKLWNSVKAIFTPIIKFIWIFIKYFTPIGMIIQLWKPLVRFFSAMWGLIKAFFKLGVTIIAFLLLYVVTPVGWFIKLFKVLPTFFKWLWNKLPSPIKDFIRFLFGIFRGIIKFVFGIGKQLYQAGKNIVTSIIDGITSVIHKITDVINNITQKIRNFLPFSPAKEGPLKDIHKIRLVETIADGIKDKDMLAKKVRVVAQKAYNAVVQPASPGLALQTISPNQAAGGSFNLTVNLSGGATQDDAKRIAAEVRKQLKLNKEARASFT